VEEFRVQELREMLLTPPPAFLQRARRRLKSKGMRFALLQQSAKSAKEREVKDGVWGS
jgi:hypothetical protein